MTKKIILSVVMILLICGCAGYEGSIRLATSDSIQNKKLPPRIAIIQENWDYYWISDFVPKALITELINVNIKVIERAQLITVLKELKFQHSGAVKDEEEKNKSIDINPLDRESIKKLGQLWGVDAILMVYVVPEVNTRGIDLATFRLVDVETAEVLLSMTIQTGKERMEGYKPSTIDILKNVAINIKKAFEKEVTTIEELLNIREYYDDKTIIVNGIANDIKYGKYISKEGKRFIDFILSDEKGNKIKVVGIGNVSINNDNKVRVEGTFKLYSAKGKGILEKERYEIIDAKVEKIKD